MSSALPVLTVPVSSPEPLVPGPFLSLVPGPFLPAQLRVRAALLAWLALLAGSAYAAQGDLTELSLEQLLDLPVVGASKYQQKQSEVAAAVSVITREEIKAFGWRTLGEAIASLPGVYTTYDRQYQQVGTRGFGIPGDQSTRMLVTINGNRVNAPVFDAGPSGRQFPLDMDLIERIEFIPGPGGAVYGQNAMFGVINVITRTGADMNRGELSVSYRAPQSGREGRASYGTVLDNGIDMLVSVSGLRSRGEDRFYDFGSTGVSGIATRLDGESSQQLFARVGRGAWSFDFVHGDHRKDDPTGVYLSSPLLPGQFQGDRYELAQLQYQDSFAGDSVHLLGRLFSGQEYYTSELRYATPKSFPATSQWRGAEFRMLYTALPGHKLMLGFEGQQNYRNDQSVLDLTNPATDRVIRGSGSRVGLYAQDEWRVTGTLSATLGVRFDHNSATGSSSSPRAGLIWQALPATVFKILYGRGNRAPSAGERDYDDGVGLVANKSLKEESVDTAELVVDHRIGADVTVRATLYAWTMYRIITLGTDPVTGLPQYQSGNTVKARGLELSASKNWQSGTRLRGSVSLPAASYLDGGRLTNSPRVLGKLNLSAPLPVAGLQLGYELRYDSRRLSLDGTELGGYVVSNLILSTQALARGLDASVGLYNLFGKRYANPGASINWQNDFEQDGLSVRVKLTYRF